MLPLLLNLTDRLVVVVGGGPVGRRKASAVRAAGGRVRLICLEARPSELNDPLWEWRSEAYSSHHLDGASLVFAAAPPEVNARVRADAQARGLWVNAATEPRRGDFFLPATVRRGDLLLAISTGGVAPALTQRIREHLEAEFDEAFGHWVALLAEMRPLVREHVKEMEQRRKILTMLGRWQWLERLRQEGIDAVRSAMRAEIETIHRG